MGEILIAIAILGGLGVVFGAVLAAASKVFYVETDPRLEQLNECLPGANCGGCGYAGCGGYAEAVLKGEAPIGKCASGGNECAQAMAAIMGVKAEAVTRKVALVRCSGQKRYDKSGNLVAGARVKAEYEGFQDCLSASRIGGNGPLSCKFGCLGFGTCVSACKYDAIHIVDGVAKVDKIDVVPQEWESVQAVFDNVFSHECRVSKLIEGLVTIASEERDMASQDFLWGYVREQVEEEATAQAIVEKIRKGGEQGLFYIDAQLAQR